MYKLHGFTAAGCKRNQFRAGNQRLNLFGDDEFQLMLCAVTQRLFRLLAQPFHHGGMAVTEDHRSPGELVVNVLVSINIAKPGSDTAFKEEWHRSFGAKRAADASRQ